MRRGVVLLDHPIGNLERCLSCSADCCRSFPAVNISWKEFTKLRELGADRLYFALSGRCKLIIENGCEFLSNNQCSIYVHRPDICKRFVCVDIHEELVSKKQRKLNRPSRFRDFFRPHKPLRV